MNYLCTKFDWTRVIPFKQAGTYRIEASYRNLDGSTAAAVTRLYVQSPANFADLPVVNELFHAEVGRVLTVGGSRSMDEVNAKLDWVIGKLSEKHPASYRLRVARSNAFSRDFKMFDPIAKKINVLDAEPDKVVELMGPVMADPGRTADSLGHIQYERVVETYTACAVVTGKKDTARQIQEETVQIFRSRGVTPSAIERAQQNLDRLK